MLLARHVVYGFCKLVHLLLPCSARFNLRGLNLIAGHGTLLWIASATLFGSASLPAWTSAPPSSLCRIGSFATTRRTPDSLAASDVPTKRGARKKERRGRGRRQSLSHGFSMLASSITARLARPAMHLPHPGQGPPPAGAPVERDYGITSWARVCANDAHSLRGSPSQRVREARTLSPATARARATMGLLRAHTALPVEHGRHSVKGSRGYIT